MQLAVAIYELQSSGPFGTSDNHPAFGGRMEYGGVGESDARRLSVDLSFNDILNRANYNNLTYSYSDVRWGTRGSGDSRGVWLTLTYVVLDKAINGKTAPGNAYDIMRTQ